MQALLVKDYSEVKYFSEDLLDWENADMVGEVENLAAPDKVTFPRPVVGRYFKLVAISAVNGNAWVCAT